MNYEGMIYRPPSEAYSLILQVTVGCANNTCTFCTMYKDKSFHIKDMETIESDLFEASQIYGKMPVRIFLADGDAMVLSTDKLKQILLLCRKYFPLLQRITSYATAGDIVRKTPEELTDLRRLGLSMVYLGVESGSSEVLKRIQKNISLKAYREAAILLRNATIKNSVTLISGLGGQELMKEHALASARLISDMKPDYLGFLTLLLEPTAPMYEEVQAGRMQLLTPPQVLDEMELFLSHVDSQGTIFRSNHASNYLTLAGTLNQDIPTMLAKIRKIRETDYYRSEDMRRL